MRTSSTRISRRRDSPFVVYMYHLWGLRQKVEVGVMSIDEENTQRHCATARLCGSVTQLIRANGLPPQSESGYRGNSGRLKTTFEGPAFKSGRATE